MVAGYLAARFKLLPDTASEVLSRFVFVIALPALIFTSLSRISVAEFFNWHYIGALGGGMLAMFAIGMIVSRTAFRGSLTATALHGLTAMYSSTAYIGLPLILTIYGDAARVPGIIGAIITGLVFAPLAIVLVEVDRGRNGNAHFMAPLLTVLSRPPVIAVALGLGVSASGVAIPVPVNAFFVLLGGAFVPCALFAAGLFIAGCSIRGATAEISWLVCAKLVLHPLITWWLAFHVFELDRLFATVAVIQAALPSGVPVFVLAQQYKTFITRSSAAIAISTALSVITVSALFVLLG
ncbi:MAG: AEC family transporter [Gammaproteobacteria bacterium]|nr:AEC family transporter [Gammaproteobacteria bacterium]